MKKSMFVIERDFVYVLETIQRLRVVMQRRSFTDRIVKSEHISLLHDVPTGRLKLVSSQPEEHRKFIKEGQVKH